MRTWWLRRSLRFRLAAWYALGGAFLLAAFSSTIYFFVAYHMGRPLDHELQQDLAVVRENLRIDADGQETHKNQDWLSHDPPPAIANSPWRKCFAENVRRHGLCSPMCLSPRAATAVALPQSPST